MKKTEQSGDENKVKKTTFTPDEYDEIVNNLEFVQAAMDVTLELDDPDTALPILCEAAHKTMAIYLFIKDMKPAEV